MVKPRYKGSEIDSTCWWVKRQIDEHTGMEDFMVIFWNLSDHNIYNITETALIICMYIWMLYIYVCIYVFLHVFCFGGLGGNEGKKEKCF